MLWTPKNGVNKFYQIDEKNAIETNNYDYEEEYSDISCFGKLNAAIKAINFMSV